MITGTILGMKFEHEIILLSGIHYILFNLPHGQSTPRFI